MSGKSVQQDIDYLSTDNQYLKEFFNFLIDNNKYDKIYQKLKQNNDDVEQQITTTIKQPNYTSVDNANLQQVYNLLLDKDNLSKELYYKLHQRLLSIYFQQNRIEPVKNIDVLFNENSDNNTMALFLAKNGLVPLKEWQHDPTLQNKNGWTVAMYLAGKGVTPPKEWEHNPALVNSYQTTVAMMFAYFGMIPPQQWYHDPTMQDYQDYTVALYLAQKNTTIPKQWCHQPQIRNIFGYTVALYQALHGKIPEQKWQHNKYYKALLESQNRFYSVKGFLEQQQIEVPEFWNYQIFQIDEENQSFSVARSGKIPQYYDQDPSYQNNKGETIAMILASQKIDVPQEWRHSPKILNANKESVAMIYAKGGIIPPQYWNHPNIIVNIKRQTVGTLLAMNGIIPPKFWLNNVGQKDSNGNSILSLLRSQGYKYQNKQFTKIQ